MENFNKRVFQDTVSYQSPIKYIPYYRELTGSITATILLSKIIEWAGEEKMKCFSKTDKEIMETTLLTKNELRTAKKKIKEIPFLKITLKGTPAKTWYEVDYKKWDHYVFEELLRKANHVR